MLRKFIGMIVLLNVLITNVSAYQEFPVEETGTFEVMVSIPSISKGPFIDIKLNGVLEPEEYYLVGFAFDPTNNLRLTNTANYGAFAVAGDGKVDETIRIRNPLYPVGGDLRLQLYIVKTEFQLPYGYVRSEYRVREGYFEFLAGMEIDISCLGTPWFMKPEEITQKKHDDLNINVYSIEDRAYIDIVNTDGLKVIDVTISTGFNISAELDPYEMIRIYTYPTQSGNVYIQINVDDMPLDIVVDVKKSNAYPSVLVYTGGYKVYNNGDFIKYEILETNDIQKV